MQQQYNRVGRVEHGSVALPGIIRSGSIGGPDNYSLGTMPSAQQQITTGQMHRGHMPPLVSRITDFYKLCSRRPEETKQNLEDAYKVTDLMPIFSNYLVEDAQFAKYVSCVLSLLSESGPAGLNGNH